MNPDPILLDPDVEEALRRTGALDLPPDDVHAARAMFRERFARIAAEQGTSRAGVSIEQTTVPSLIDDHAIPVRIYRPTAGASGRGLVYVHGGAFYLGDLDAEDHVCCAWARGASCVVVSVDYRLAPEHRFPVPLEDCHAALVWTADHAEALSIDPRRLGVAGNSAGGALAAGLCQLVRDRSGPAIALQMLLYPVLDASLSSPAIQALPAEDRGNGVRIWERYLGRPPSEAPVYASPAAAKDLTNLPAAYIATATHDPLRDEALTYAQRLLHAGVSVELHVWPNVTHSFEHYARTATLAQRSLTEQTEAIGRALDRRP
jgi:acetyl esterase